MAHQQQPRASLSLFPNPHISNPQPPNSRNQTPLGRRSESRERRTPTPQQYQQSMSQDIRAASPQASPPRQTGRQTPQHQPVTLSFDPPPVQVAQAGPADPPQQYHQQQQQQQQQQHPQQQHWPLSPQFDLVVQQPTPGVNTPEHAGPAFFESASYNQHNQTRDSLAKPPLSDDPSSQLQSIFPTYNPQIALEHQQYAPTQTSPTHIPRNIISRQGNYGMASDDVSDDDESHIPGPVRSPDRSTEPARRWPRVPQQPPTVPTVCTTEQLKSLWRVANGWRASPSEGRVYCLKLEQEKDAPVYTLSSQTQPFWNMRIDPTSVSARATLSRHDPSKPFKSTKADSPSSSVFRGSAIGGSGSLKRASLGQNWQQSLITTLEEESRRHQPEDGLVAMLRPTPAMKMAEERSEAPAAVEMAENETARLVWDDDTASYFFVHHALQKPFFVNIERSPAWSRTEYTLEHTESPLHLAKLTRDGSGGGWLELDTGLASKIDSFYILDVAVSALIIVASLDEKNSPTAIEAFEAPPAIQEPKPVKKPSRSLMKGRKKVEEFEIDLESQDDSVGKGSAPPKVKERKTEDRLPFLLRAIVKLVKGVFKLFILILTGIAKMFGLVFKCFYKCVGSKY